MFVMAVPQTSLVVSLVVGLDSQIPCAHADDITKLSSGTHVLLFLKGQIPEAIRDLEDLAILSVSRAEPMIAQVQVEVKLHVAPATTGVRSHVVAAV